MTGITRGLQLIAEFFRLYFYAIKTNQTDCQAACVGIMAQWYYEVTHQEIEDAIKAKSSVAIKVSLANLLLGIGSDPFQGSRQMLQQAQAKWGKH